MDFLPFLPPKDCGGVQLCVLTFIYGGILYQSADLIGSGSELLLLVPSAARLVGSVVLPVLGAVPDGMMVLFSGLGEEAQEEVQVGVGALAGSTVMLLTIPWFIAIYAGRVNIINGKPKYTSPKLDPENFFHWDHTGVSVGPLIRTNAVLMLITMLSYFIVQIPAFMYADEPRQTIHEKAMAVRTPAMIGCIVCVLFFGGYLYMQMGDEDYSEKEENHAKSNKITKVQIEAIRSGKITLRGTMYGALEESENARRNPNPKSLDKRDSEINLLSKKDQIRIKKLLKPFFTYYDTNRDATLERVEFSKIMKDLNEIMTVEEEDQLFKSVDWDNSDSIDFEEFAELMVRYAKGEVGRPLVSRSVVTPQKFCVSSTVADEASLEEDEDEEDEMPDDLIDLSPEEQQARIKIRALWMMGIGTLLVLIFSDPAVDVLNEIGRRVGINPFYVSFVLAPLASNASEMFAATQYGLRKTKKMMTISLSTLLGAACMNNTFCLGIFFAIVWGMELAWTFSAEVTCIIVAEIWVGFIAMSGSTQTMKKAGMVLASYPLCLLLVYVLENFFGWD